LIISRKSDRPPSFPETFAMPVVLRKLAVKPFTTHTAYAPEPTLDVVTSRTTAWICAAGTRRHQELIRKRDVQASVYQAILAVFPNLFCRSDC